MDESFLKLKGKKVTGKDTNKYFGRLSDILVNKDTNEIIGIVSRNDAIIYRHRLFYIKDIYGWDAVNIYVNGYGERFVKVVPIYTDFTSCGNHVMKRKAVYPDGTNAGKVQNINFNLEMGTITGLEVGFSLAQDLLNGRKLCPVKDTISFYQGNVVVDKSTRQDYFL